MSIKTRIRTVLKQYVQNRERHYNGRGYINDKQRIAIRHIVSHLNHYRYKSERAHCIMMKQVGRDIDVLKPESYEHEPSLQLYATLQRLQKEAHIYLHENQTSLKL
jgi:Ribonuclease G/E